MDEYRRKAEEMLQHSETQSLTDLFVGLVGEPKRKLPHHMSDYLLPFLVAFHPQRGAGRITALAAWWRPFVAIAAASILTALFSHACGGPDAFPPPATATPEDAAQVRQWLDAGLPPGPFSCCQAGC